MRTYPLVQRRLDWPCPLRRRDRQSSSAGLTVIEKVNVAAAPALSLARPLSVVAVVAESVPRERRDDYPHRYAAISSLRFMFTLAG